MKKRFIMRIASAILAITLIVIWSPLGIISAGATQTMSHNFSKDYTLTGDYREDIVAVAEAQYKKSQAALGYTEAWCADFVCDCGKLAGIPNFPYYGGCDGLITRLMSWGGAWHAYNSTYVPQKGDIVFFSKYSNTSTDSTHVGIVYSSGFNSDGSVNTIEGNTGLNGVHGYVNIKKRTISYTSDSELYILGYIELNSSSASSSSTNPDNYPICERDLVYNSTIERGEDVKWVQCILKHLGYSIDIDGSYGPSSRDTIKKFQSAYGLTVDGMCGPTTRAKLKEAWASKGHTWNSGTVVTSATHTTTGVKNHKCNYCEATKNEAIAKIPGCTYGAWQDFSSTQHKRTCACGNYELNNHEWDNGTVTVSASYTQEGLKTYECRYCNGTKTETIPMLVTPENAPQIVVGDYEVAAGGTVKVEVAINNNPGIASLILKVAYDNSLMTLTDVQYNTAMGGQTIIPADYSSPVTLYWINAFENMSEDVVFATLTFKVNENTTSESVADIVVSYDANDIYNLNEENIELVVQNGSVTVIDYVPGDINGDGIVNNKDVTRLMQFYAGWDVVVNEAALDVNGDGIANNKDVTRLMQFLAGWDVEIY